MKVLQILPELNVGGVETGTLDLCRYLITKGHQAVVVSGGGKLVEELEQIGVKHYTLPANEKSLFSILRMIDKLSVIIREEKVAIVHARSRVPAWATFFACRRTNTAFITTCHGYYSHHFFSRVMAWPKLVICPSRVIARHMVEDFGLPHERLRLIPRSVNLEKFPFRAVDSRPAEEFIVGIIGRITPLKGHEYFLRAMAKVIRQVPSLKVWIIGDAPEGKQDYKQELMTLVRRLVLSNYVEFLGNRSDIPELLSHMHCLVLSTVTEEAFGRVILEAQAAGVPVVATRVGGVVDIVDEEKTGLLVTPRDPDEMAAATIRIFKDKTLSRRLSAAGRRKVEQQFTLKEMGDKTLKVYDELLHLQNILVIKLGAVGDVILVTPSLRAIRGHFPRAKIFCLTGKEGREVLQRCPFLDDLIVYDYKEANRGIKGLLCLGQQLRRYNFDLAIDFQNSRKSHWLSFLSLARQRCGYDRKFGFLLNQKVKYDGGQLPAVEHQFQLLQALGIKPQDRTLKLWPAKTDEDYVAGLLDSEWLSEVTNIVGINIAASEKWLSKSWPIENIVRLCDELSRRNIRVVLTGTLVDMPKAERIMRLTKSRPVNFTGKTTIMQLASLIKRCKVYISADSAPLHIAAAMGAAVIGLFGPTSPQRHMPPAEKFAIIKGKADCAPCYKPNCRRVECMYSIGVEEVLEAIMRFLD
ncbi:MAG: GT4 family glycosyltransferase PelF [Candidatus Omnitrophota bacterium]